METQEPRQIGVPLIIGIVLMPYFFVWLLFRAGYSNVARVAGMAYLGVLVIAFAASLNDASKGVDPVGQPAAVAEEGAASTEGQATVPAGLVSYNDGSVPIYRKFAGEWVKQNMEGAPEQDFYFFTKEGVSRKEAADPFYGENLWVTTKTEQIAQKYKEYALDVLGLECEDFESEYGRVGDRQQRIGLNLVKQYRGAYYYQISCDGERIDDGIKVLGSIYIKTGIRELVNFDCSEECGVGNATELVDGSEVRNYAEDKEFPSVKPAPNPEMLEVPASEAGSAAAG